MRLSFWTTQALLVVAFEFKLDAPIFSSLGPKIMNSTYRNVVPNVHRSG